MLILKQIRITDKDKDSKTDKELCQNDPYSCQAASHCFTKQFCPPWACSVPEPAWDPSGCIDAPAQKPFWEENVQRPVTF